MVKPELGTKRICPETGRKFYDLNKDPIVSPYTGNSYPRSFFESGAEKLVEEDEEIEEKELDAEDGPEIVSLEEADEETKSDDTDLPDIDDEEVDLGDDDDTFLEEEEEDNDDVSDIISVGEEDDEH
ncbi:TIGR02300 family protein [Chelativorans sp. AA-79]|uniref:TIGR02300 family protein n=1 Tax=Chelativorans sp. AA-79 TaxID=3028735 RepID=UPI0023F913FF|nr:TIGR02300 family protein [Chelativorans sp. AA-79]WEX09510.1 TIGR02300 family protein [Chelativorans sp. AA-79]